MPVRSYNKVEAKYNVTTDFPSLGLHSAAVTGNLGLVEYALVNGQPVNSVLDGVLPLHAACAGGHVQVVKLLLEWGADVNAPRLPRRYSNDKNRDSSAPIVGTSGSTPLHFAAANGNSNVVSILLLHGAHADRPDKHGVTPEMLAKQNGWLECAQVLRDWILNKDRDLKERETINAPAPIPLHSSNSHDASLGSTDAESPTSLSGKRRLQVKHSIDTALNMLKSPSCVFDSHIKSSARSTFSPNTPPASPTRLPESIASPESPVGNGRMSPIGGPRRPSLPHIFAAPPRNPKAPNPSASFLSVRRPQSAGTDAEREDEETQSVRNASGKRLGSKYSLMNMFRKAHTDVPSAGGLPDFRPGSSPKQALTVQAAVEASSIADDSKKDKESTSNFSNRFHRGSDASTRSQPCSRSRNLPNLDDIALSDDANVSNNKRVFSDMKSSSPLSVMSILRGRDHNRERSCSNGSSYSIPTSQASPVKEETFSTTSETDAKKGFPRPGILLGHSRSASSGQNTPISSSYRPLRFEYSLNDPEDIGSTELNHSLRSVNSAGSLARITARQDAQSHCYGLGIGRVDLPPASAPAGYFDKHRGGASQKLRSPSIVLSTRLKEGRISSLSSSSDSSISLLANDGPIAEDYGKYPMHSGLPSRSLPERTSMSMIHTLGKDISGIRTGVANGRSKGSSAFEIDIRTISSHAQAEALVQQTQKEILEMGEQETLLALGSPGNTPLSARLAAYGESLALERKFREEMQNQDHTEGNGRLSPSTKSFSSVTPTRSHIKIARQHSLDEQFGSRREAHRQGSLQVPVESSYSRPATSLGYNHQISDAHQTVGIVDSLLTSAQVSPIDSLEQDLEFGSPLFRMSTAPLSNAANTDRSTIVQARNAKLTKMGFVPNEQGTRVPPTQTKGFGGLNFKNIMQTFKGKA
ncbi:hypothetical protein APHAL10511_000161 [Amanita phalloides]|nr:hypothetical protein APHAL10511_000161 [Amanita phalloides]